MTTTPRVSIVIPIYNEEAILNAAILDLREKLDGLGWPYEILLAENGSTDRTLAVAAEIEHKHPEVRHFSVEAPNYGRALKEGILRAQGEFVICDEIDLCDVDFYRTALDLLEKNEVDLVIGSKLAAGAEDQLPVLRHFASLVINGMLRVALGFKGTDTHGLKAFRRAALVDVARSCLVDKDLFASEFVIRAERSGVRTREVPVRVVEKRKPSINLFRRVPNVMRNLVKLFVAIRLRG